MNAIKLEKGIIHLLLPFRLTSKWAPETTSTENDVWAKTNEDISRLDFLLEHVKDFFTRNSKSELMDEAACIIMKLNIRALPVKMFNNKIFWLSNRPFDSHQNAKNLLKFPVYIDPGSFRLIIHPFTSVAILLFSIELVKSGKNSEPPNLADFIQMNYLIRLFNRHDEAYLISQNERIEERSKANQLTEGKSTDMFKKDEPENIEQRGWRPRNLINYLLFDLNIANKVEFFDHYHFSPVCYVQPAEEMKDEEMVHQTLFFLRKVYDFAT
jgi:hypothetical protein